MIAVVECQRCKRDYIPANRAQKRHCRFCGSNKLKLNKENKQEEENAMECKKCGGKEFYKVHTGYRCCNCTEHYNHKKEEGVKNV